MSLARRVAYALGNAGFNLTSQIVVAIGIYYYLPPGHVSDLEPLLSAELHLGVFTAYGMARLLGGVVDSLADPVVGHFSDRSRSRLGRRRSFMIYGIVPMVGTPVLLFFPPGEPGSDANFVHLAVLLTVYFVFFTVYVAPYLALLPEIARSQEERVALSRLFALVGFPVLAFYGPGWQLGVDWARSAGVPSETAIRAVVVVSSVLALAICLAPILAIDERRLRHAVPSDLSLRDAVLLTLRNGPFLVYLGAQILFILGVQMVLPWLPYLAEVVLGRDLSFAAVLGLAAVVPGLAGFLLVPRVVEFLGPKRTIVGSAGALGALLCLLGLLEPGLPGGGQDQRNLALAFGVMVLLGPTIAVFLILPNVVLAQLIDQDEVRTGANRSAMYLGAQGLLTKWAYAASAVVLSYLFVEYGNSRDAPLGVVLVGPVAGALCLGAAGLYALYPEKRVLLEGSAASR